MAELDTSGRLERVLGPGWEGMGYSELSTRACTLETAAGFARTLSDYMIDAEHRTAGEALAALAARNGDGERPG